MRTILAIFAHPDDEAFGVGGTLSLYADAGDRVALICATSGEAGLNRLDAEATARLGEVRREELRAACTELGIEPPVFLGYLDSGMAGTPENEHPDSLNMADLDEVARKLAEIIREEEADVVITFERYGWYGHPDHMKIHKAVRRAYEMLELDEQPVLYFAVFPAEAMRYSAYVMEQAGEEVPDMFRNRERMRYRLDMIPIVVDTTSVAGRKIAALNAHRTQMGPTGIEGRFRPEILGSAPAASISSPPSTTTPSPRSCPSSAPAASSAKPHPTPSSPTPSSRRTIWTSMASRNPVSDQACS